MDILLFIYKTDKTVLIHSRGAVADRQHLLFVSSRLSSCSLMSTYNVGTVQPSPPNPCPDVFFLKVGF